MAGVPLIGELSKNLGKTTEEIQNMVSKGQVGFKDVEEAFKSIQRGWKLTTNGEAG